MRSSFYDKRVELINDYKHKIEEDNIKVMDAIKINQKRALVTNTT